MHSGRLTEHTSGPSACAALGSYFYVTPVVASVVLTFTLPGNTQTHTCGSGWSVPCVSMQLTLSN